MSRDCLPSLPLRLEAVACCWRDAVRFARFPRLFFQSPLQKDGGPHWMFATLLCLQTSSSLCIAICLPDCGICQPISGLHCSKRPKLYPPSPFLSSAKSTPHSASLRNQFHSPLGTTSTQSKSAERLILALFYASYELVNEVEVTISSTKMVEPTTLRIIAGVKDLIKPVSKLTTAEKVSKTDDHRPDLPSTENRP